MEQILRQLQDNMQLIYRKAVDADEYLNKLHAQGHGKFQEVFAIDAGFNVKSKRFGPYVEDLAKDILALQNGTESELEQVLPPIIKKMELLLSTLAQLRQATKAK